MNTKQTVGMEYRPPDQKQMKVETSQTVWTGWLQSKKRGQKAAVVVISTPSSHVPSISSLILWLQSRPNHSTCFLHHLCVAIPLGAEWVLRCSVARWLQTWATPGMMMTETCLEKWECLPKIHSALCVTAPFFCCCWCCCHARVRGAGRSGDSAHVGMNVCSVSTCLLAFGCDWLCMGAVIEGWLSNNRDSHLPRRTPVPRQTCGETQRPRLVTKRRSHCTPLYIPILWQRVCSYMIIFNLEKKNH